MRLLTPTPGVAPPPWRLAPPPALSLLSPPVSAGRRLALPPRRVCLLAPWPGPGSLRSSGRTGALWPARVTPARGRCGGGGRGCGPGSETSGSQSPKQSCRRRRRRCRHGCKGPHSCGESQLAEHG
uniref:Potassium/sodium hyperpolarization-activated cyclic nucleotide-gated channel 2-like n=1 Tax=Phascolarctos cinereus TaxID=38626 RepID=A0A6P5JBV6_PHACI|nr:potassium/sodium hyperpolarization-activated cyclic nucleotide-gated channel 2-like [Phascolarctos cinereus]